MPTSPNEVPLQYVLVIDHVGMPTMLLFGVARDAGPLGVLPVVPPLPAHTPMTGRAIARGSFRSGELLTLTVDGETLRPSGLLAPDTSVMLSLANADVLRLAPT